jgi:hypothetical protein
MALWKPWLSRGTNLLSSRARQVALGLAGVLVPLAVVWTEQGVGFRGTRSALGLSLWPLLAVVLGVRYRHLVTQQRIRERARGLAWTAVGVSVVIALSVFWNLPGPGASLAFGAVVATTVLLVPPRVGWASNPGLRTLLLWREPLAWLMVLGLGLLGALRVGAGARVAFDHLRAGTQPNLAVAMAQVRGDRASVYFQDSLINALTRRPDFARETIATVEISADPDELTRLEPRRARRGGVEIAADLRLAGQYQRVRLSLRGDNIYHWGTEQKSFRVSFGKVDAPMGQRALNIINPRDVLGVETLFGEELARTLGLLHPGSWPCRLILNRTNLGLYVCQPQTSEAWLRSSKRVPGNVYVGDRPVNTLDTVAGEDPLVLWKDPNVWTQVAQVELLPPGRPELRAFLNALTLLRDARTEAELRNAREGLEDIADVEAFLKLSALQAFTTGWHQDDQHNWRIYFDPSRGRFEPIVWDAAFSWERRTPPGVLHPYPNTVDRALLRIPEWHELRLRALHEQLVSPELTEQRMVRFVRAHFEAAKGTLMSAQTLDLASTDTWSDQGFLMWNSASRLELEKRVQEREKLIRQHAVRLSQELEAVHLTHGRCTVGKEVASCSVVLDSMAPVLVAGQARVSPDLGSDEPGGKVSVRPTEQVFGLTRAVFPAALPPEAELPVKNLVTGTTSSVRFVLEEGTATRPPSPVTPPPERVLGPGRVLLSQTLRLPRGQDLRVEPGTTVALGPGVSIIVEGRVVMSGRADAPIVLERLDPQEPWGGLLVLEPRVPGTRLSHVNASGGTLVRHGFLNVTGMISFHRVHGLVLESVTLSQNTRSDDTLHIIHSDNVEVQSLTVGKGAGDCVDFDYVRGSVGDARIGPCANDGLDFMTSTVTVRNSQMADCGDKGASVGEASTLTLTGSTFVRDNIGVQSKDFSRVLLWAPTFQSNRLDVSAYRKSAYYMRGGCLAVQAPLEQLTSEIDELSQLEPLDPTRGQSACGGKL